MIEFIIRYLCPSTHRAIRGEGYEAAIRDILVFKDKIYTEPVTLVGDDQKIFNCTFLGVPYGVKIESAALASGTFNP